MSEATPPQAPEERCPKCAWKLSPGDRACPECGLERGAPPVGMSLGAAAGLVLWPLGLVLLSALAGDGGLLVLAGVVQFFNGPIALVVVSRSHAPRGNGGVRDLHAAKPSAVVLVLVLLGITWLLPLLALGGCLLVALQYRNL